MLVIITKHDSEDLSTEAGDRQADEPDTLKELILVTPRDGKRPKLSTIVSNVQYFVPPDSCAGHL